MTTASAPAKVNLALVVGPLRGNGKHEVVTVLQRLDLADRLTLEPAPALKVTGFADDTLVTRALRELAATTGGEPAWQVHIEKRIPLAAGLGGGSSDAATALRLANGTLADPLPPDELRRLAARLGADVPFFLSPGPQLGTADGTELEAIQLPLDYHVLLLLPDGVGKASTAGVYQAFDRRAGERHFEGRRDELLRALRNVTRPQDLADLPRNDLASSRLAEELEGLGAFRADVSGAGPTVYGLFAQRRDAEAAAGAARRLGKTWICEPTWYG